MSMYIYIDFKALQMPGKELLINAIKCPAKSFKCPAKLKNREHRINHCKKKNIVEYGIFYTIRHNQLLTLALVWSLGGAGAGAGVGLGLGLGGGGGDSGLGFGLGLGFLPGRANCTVSVIESSSVSIVE